MICFKCGRDPGSARHSHAMHASWYETSHPHRTIHLCDGCYKPDTKAGKRTTAEWEHAEAIWGEVPTDTDAGSLWERYRDGDHDAVYAMLFSD